MAQGRLHRRGGRRLEATAIDADRAAVDANLDLMMKRVARLPGKGSYLIVIWTNIAVVSGVILFAEKLRALLGI